MPTRDLSASTGGGGFAQANQPEVDNTMRQLLNYDTIKMDGPKKKIIEFAAADNLLDDKDVKKFEKLCASLADKNNFWQTKLDRDEAELMDKLLNFPIDKVFPCLDLYRIFLLHPDSTVHFKKFEDGLTHLFRMLGVLERTDSPDPAVMLALRCICNMFKDMSAQFVLKERASKVYEAVKPKLMHQKANIREAAITVLLDYSVVLLLKDESEGKAKVEGL